MNESFCLFFLFFNCSLGIQMLKNKKFVKTSSFSVYMDKFTWEIDFSSQNLITSYVAIDGEGGLVLFGRGKIFSNPNRRESVWLVSKPKPIQGFVLRKVSASFATCFYDHSASMAGQNFNKSLTLELFSERGSWQSESEDSCSACDGIPAAGVRPLSE